MMRKRWIWMAAVGLSGCAPSPGALPEAERQSLSRALPQASPRLAQAREDDARLAREKVSGGNRPLASNDQASLRLREHHFGKSSYFDPEVGPALVRFRQDEPPSDAEPHKAHAIKPDAEAESSPAPLEDEAPQSIEPPLSVSSPPAENSSLASPRSSAEPPASKPLEHRSEEAEKLPPGLLAGPQLVEECVRRALNENRGVRAAWSRAQALKWRIPQASALPDPVVENEVQPFPKYGQQLTSGYMPWSLSVSQQFPWFGVRSLRGAAAAREAEIAVQAWHQAQLDVAAQVRQAYAELARVHRSLAVFADIEKQANEYVELARIRVETPTGTETGLQREFFQAEQAVSDLTREIAQTRSEFFRGRAELNRLMHQPPDLALEPLAAPQDAAAPDRLEELIAQATSLRPDLKSAIASIERDRVLVALAEKKGKPDVTVGLVYQLMTREDALSPIADGNDNIGFMVGFNLPIYRGKIAAGVEEARHQAASSAQSFEDRFDQAAAEVAGRYYWARTARETRDLLRDSVLPKAERALEAAFNDYQASRGDLFILNSVTRDVLRTKLEILRQEAELAKALAALEQAVGGPFALQTTPPPAPRESGRRDADIARPAEPAAGLGQGP